MWLIRWSGAHTHTHTMWSKSNKQVYNTSLKWWYRWSSTPLIRRWRCVEKPIERGVRLWGHFSGDNRTFSPLCCGRTRAVPKTKNLICYAKMYFWMLPCIVPTMQCSSGTVKAIQSMLNVAINNPLRGLGSGISTEPSRHVAQHLSSVWLLDDWRRGQFKVRISFQ